MGRRKGTKDSYSLGMPQKQSSNKCSCQSPFGPYGSGVPVPPNFTVGLNLRMKRGSVCQDHQGRAVAWGGAIVIMAYHCARRVPTVCGAARQRSPGSCQIKRGQSRALLDSESSSFPRIWPWRRRVHTSSHSMCGLIIVIYEGQL